MSTGRKKFSKLASSIALAAVPLNHFSPKAVDENTAIKITPETYSGVAVVVMEIVDNVRSVRLPSRIPANMPMINALGIMRSMTQNINLPVRDSLIRTSLPISSLNTVENPQSPCKTPQNFAAFSGCIPGLMHFPRIVPSLPSMTYPGRTPSHCPYLTGNDCK